jgi:hypothetical protein
VVASVVQLYSHALTGNPGIQHALASSGEGVSRLVISRVTSWPPLSDCLTSTVPSGLRGGAIDGHLTKVGTEEAVARLSTQ